MHIDSYHRLNNYLVMQVQRFLASLSCLFSALASNLSIHSHLTHCQSYFQLVNDGEWCCSKQPASVIIHFCNKGQEPFKLKNIKCKSSHILPN